MQRDDDTQKLLLDWRSGDRDAGNRLLYRYVPELTGFFGRRSSRNADELVQRTLLACAQNFARFEGRSTFRTYLFGIARNQYLMFQRGEAFSRREAEPATLASAPEESPSQLAAVREEQVVLVAALRRLEPEYSLVLRKFYGEEQSLVDIARELEIPLGTVKSRLTRGRAALKAKVTEVSLRDEVRDEALLELAHWFAARPD